MKLQSSEVERLDAALADLESSATAADEERTTLAEEKEKLTAASTVVEANIGELETQLKRELKGLPEPLIEKIKPLIRRLPKDPAKTELSLAERVQNIVGILSQADKFNTTITQTSESHEIDGGKTVGVRTLLLCLGHGLSRGCLRAIRRHRSPRTLWMGMVPYRWLRC